MISETLGISERTVADYQNINKNLPEENKEEFDAGNISITDAKKIIKKKQKKKINNQAEEKAEQKNDGLELIRFLNEIINQLKQAEKEEYIKLYPDSLPNLSKIKKLLERGELIE